MSRGHSQRRAGAHRGPVAPRARALMTQALARPGAIHRCELGRALVGVSVRESGLWLGVLVAPGHRLHPDPPRALEAGADPGWRVALAAAAPSALMSGPLVVAKLAEGWRDTYVVLDEGAYLGELQRRGERLISWIADDAPPAAHAPTVRATSLAQALRRRSGSGPAGMASR